MLFEAVAFGSGTSTAHQDLFKELLQDLFQVKDNVERGQLCTQVNIIYVRDLSILK